MQLKKKNLKHNNSELQKHKTNKVYQQQQQKQKQQTKQDQWSLAMRWPGWWNHHATLLLFLWSPSNYNDDFEDQWSWWKLWWIPRWLWWSWNIYVHDINGWSLGGVVHDVLEVGMSTMSIMLIHLWCNLMSVMSMVPLMLICVCDAGMCMMLTCLWCLWCLIMSMMSSHDADLKPRTAWVNQSCDISPFLTVSPPLTFWGIGEQEYWRQNMLTAEQIYQWPNILAADQIYLWPCNTWQIDCRLPEVPKVGVLSQHPCLIKSAQSQLFREFPSCNLLILQVCSSKPRWYLK